MSLIQPVMAQELGVASLGTAASSSMLLLLCVATPAARRPGLTQRLRQVPLAHKPVAAVGNPELNRCTGLAQSHHVRGPTEEKFCKRSAHAGACSNLLLILLAKRSLQGLSLSCRVGRRLPTCPCPKEEGQLQVEIEYCGI